MKNVFVVARNTWQYKYYLRTLRIAKINTNNIVWVTTLEQLRGTRGGVIVLLIGWELYFPDEQEFLNFIEMRNLNAVYSIADDAEPLINQLQII